MFDLFFALNALIVIGFSARILLREDLTPPARLAWFIVLLVLPYAGGVVYLLFGEVDILGHARARHEKIFAEIRDKAGEFLGRPETVRSAIDPVFQPSFAYAASINGFHPVTGNRAELLPDDEAFNDRLVADIDAAEDHVHVLYYIWLTDRTGTDVAEALARAARRGVTCRAMADAIGARAMIRSEHWEKMREAGVELAVALPIGNVFRTLFISRVDLRNHRKISVIDSKITYCGSRNTADPEFRPKAKYAPWVDIMCRLEGPVVAQKQLLFASDWMRATGQSLDVIPIRADIHPDGFPALVIGDGPTERDGATPQLFSTLAASAHERMVISTPYFVPDEVVLDAICAAAHRGVKVDMIFPRDNDSLIVAAASRSYYLRLLRAGCRIYEYEGGLLHAKTLTIDGKVTLIGSSNLDLRSFDLNYENNVLLQDEELTGKILEQQHAYREGAIRVTHESVAQWPAYRRIANNVIATIGPIL